MVKYAFLLWYGHEDDRQMELLSAWSNVIYAKQAWMKERKERGWSGWRERKPGKDWVLRATADSGVFLVVQQVRLEDVE